jgi:hypothetical protein
MDPLPMAPGCALDESGLRSQYERYRQAGAGARVVDRARHASWSTSTSTWTPSWLTTCSP